MYRKQKITKTSITRNESLEGETIEQKIERIVNNREPITDGAPLVYSERQEGVIPAYNIRTDRFEIAVEAMDKVTMSKLAKRDAKIVELNKQKEDGKAEPTQGQADPQGGNPTT